MSVIQLGALLGPYGGGHMSFESLDEWSINLGQNSASQQTTNVHSSPTGLRIELSSRGGSSADIFYVQHGVDGDALSRMSPAITDHQMLTLAWAKIDTAAASGSLRIRGVTTSGYSLAPIAHADSLQLHELGNLVSSEDLSLIHTSFNRLASTGSYSAYVDDVLAVIDPFELPIEWSAREVEEQHMAAPQFTVTGKTPHAHVWGQNLGWEFPVYYVPSSLAVLMDFWYKKGLNLMLRINSGDPYVVRFNAPPAPSLIKPYGDAWQGVLSLRRVRPGLWF